MNHDAVEVTRRVTAQRTVGRGTALMVVLALTTACEPSPESLFNAPAQIVDLSPTITEDLLTRVRGERQLRDRGRRGVTTLEHIIRRDPLYVANAFVELYDHAGAHVDAPSHVIEGAPAVDEMPLDAFIGPAKVFDFSHKEPGEPIARSELMDRGIASGDIVILHVAYEAPGPDEFPMYPYLSGDAAEYLAGIPIKAFASDMPSTGSFSEYGRLAAEGASGSEQVVAEHYAFLSRGIPNIEGLVNLESILGEDDVVFVGFPPQAGRH